MSSLNRGENPLPSTVSDWKKMPGNSHDSPYGLRWVSASNVTMKHFLSLRCVWQVKREKPHENTNIQRSMGLYQFYNSASRWLDRFPPYQAFLEHVKNGTQLEPWNIGDSKEAANGIAIMEIPKRRQEKVIQGARSRDLDEEMVVASIMGYLESITLRHPDIRCDWSPQKKHFVAKFGDTELRAQVDGLLVKSTSGEVKALVEAKKSPRRRGDWKVPAQETAEIVALLKTYPPNQPPPRSPFYLLAQDCTEFFVIVAAFTPSYFDYIHQKRKTLQDCDFLRIQRYGPWDIKKADDLDTFAKTALAIALKGSQ